MIAWLWGGFIVGTTVALAAGGLLLVRRALSPSILKSHNDVAGFIYAVIGVIYAVLLAFTVIVAWERHDAAETRVEQEANELGDLFRDAEAFPDPIRTQLRARIRAYARVVLEEEWPAMANGEASPSAWAVFNQLWRSYAQVAPQTARDQAWHAESLDRLNELGDYRRLRLLSSRSSVPRMLWVVLVAGGMITVGFSYLFGTEDARLHMVMVAALSATVALVLLLLSALEHPFSGTVAVGPEAFRQLKDIFDHWAQS